MEVLSVETVIRLQKERDVAIRLLAEWVCAIDRNGTSWDDWDECYKDAKYRESPIRELMDKAINKNDLSINE